MGYTQQELAELLGVTKQQYGRWEKGHNEPGNEILKNLSKILEVTTDYLLGADDTPPASSPSDGPTPLEKQVLRAFHNGDLKRILRLMDEIAPETTRDIRDLIVPGSGQDEHDLPGQGQ